MANATYLKNKRARQLLGYKKSRPEMIRYKPTNSMAKATYLKNKRARQLLGYKSPAPVH